MIGIDAVNNERLVAGNHVAVGILFRHAKSVIWNKRVAQVLTFMARAIPAPRPVVVHAPIKRRPAEAAPIIKGFVS
jgi:hypothetical protein